MGYSCTAIASYVVAAVEAKIKEAHPEHRASNAMPDGGFWERGREQRDGAITGTVFKVVRVYTQEEREAAAKAMGGGVKADWIGDPCRKAGSMKVSAEGKVVRWAGVPRAWFKAAEEAGAKRYREVTTAKGAATANFVARTGMGDLDIPFKHPI